MSLAHRNALRVSRCAPAMAAGGTQQVGMPACQISHVLEGPGLQPLLCAPLPLRLAQGAVLTVWKLSDAMQQDF